MAAAHSFVTPEQFAELYSEGQKPHFEYWFGEAIQKPMPTLIHGVMQWVLAMLLARRGWKASTEVRLKISKVAYPVPDIVANHKSFATDSYPTEAFDLCVEILSPADNLPRVFNKCAHYLDWGISSVWIIDPEKQTAYSMSIENPRPIPVSMSGDLGAGSGESEINLPLSELFAEVDKNLG